MFFLYKIEHKDKVSKCACGNQTISGICVEQISSKLRGTASKCSSSSSSNNFSSIFSSRSNSSSIFSSNSNSDSNLRSSFNDSNSNSNSNSYSNSNSNSNSDSNSYCSSNSNSGSNSNFNSNMQSNCRANGESLHIEFDITNKICNRCRVIKQITCFDKKRSQYVKNVIQLKLSVNIVLRLLALVG